MPSPTRLRAATAAAFLALSAANLTACANGSQSPTDNTHANLSYAGDSLSQTLDLYLPEDPTGPSTPLVIYIHGGGWQIGDKASVNDTEVSDIKALKDKFLGAGYAVAAVNYRLSGEALWPAQIFDVKSAVRYLSAHALEYGLDAERFAAFGESAGGHLVALLTTTNGDPNMEGTVGSSAGSSRVDVGVSFYGVYNIPPAQYQAATDCGPGYGEVGQAKLFGGPVTVSPYLEAAILASPVNYVDSTDAPLMLLHGTADCVVSHQQADEMEAKLVAAGVPTDLISLDAEHSAKVFFTDPQVTDQVLRFVADHI